MVSAILAPDFYVVGLATDGRQALEIARRVDPDVIVLEVDMPVMNGFQTVRALKQGGVPTPPVVFLSAHEADDLVDEAFRCGGRGYVVESRVRDDLATALDQALLGRLFVPSLTALFRLTPGGGHAMQLHVGVEALLDDLAAYFDLALRRGDATCVIATPLVRGGLAARLRARGWHVDGSSGHPRYRTLDAAGVLRRYMRRGRPDADRLAGIVAELDQYRQAVAESAASRLILFSTMVESLGNAGKTQAVIDVERLWTTLTHDLPFVTLCGYSTSCFHTRVPHLWSDVCTEHGMLSHASDVQA
jgi:CheY-like chemotaxis protein